MAKVTISIRASLQQAKHAPGVAQLVIEQLPVGRVHAPAVVDGRAGAVVRPRTSLVIAWYLIIPREHPN